MRYAIITDIHGNSIALDAVFASIEAQGGVDSWLVGGDLCAIGPDPIGVIERLQQLPQAQFVLGNTDYYILNNYLNYPPPTIEHALHNAENIGKLAEVSRSFSWTQGMITAAGHFDWVAALPVEIRIILPDGTKLLLVHARPGHHDGRGITPVDSDADIAELFACEDDLILVGHVHWPQQRHLNGKHIVNPGAVGNPVGEDVVANYAILEADKSGYQIRQYQAHYDAEAVLTQIETVHHPTPDYISQFYRGEFLPPWYQEFRATE